jgi:hypothetical protein
MWQDALGDWTQLLNDSSATRGKPTTRAMGPKSLQKLGKTRPRWWLLEI